MREEEREEEEEKRIQSFINGDNCLFRCLVSAKRKIVTLDHRGSISAVIFDSVCYSL